MRILSSILLACVLACGSSYAANPVYPLFADGGRLLVEDKAGVLSVGKMETIVPAGEAGPEAQRAWVGTQADIPMWTLALTDPQGDKQTVTALDAQGTVRKASEKRIVLEWSRVQPGDLRVVATVEARGADFAWGLDIEVRGSGYALWDVVYPEIGPLAFPERVHSITPYGWGLIHDDLLQRRHERIYPGAAQAMPFVAVSDGETGLYLGAHDPRGYAMRFFVGRTPDGQAASFGIRHDVEGMGVAREYHLPYEVVTTPYRGDWYEAGRIYREAAYETPWGDIPPHAKRGDIPDWLRDTDLWLVGSCHDETTANQIIEFAEFFEVPTSAHVYQWHEIPFDDHYPEYFPAKPGFADAVRKVQDAGIPVMPYINGRLWDSATDSWRDRNAVESCALDENGEKYVEVYGSKVPLSPMCPATPLWQEMVTGLVDRLLNEVGVQAVYIDQISAASAKRCFARNHGHPVGGGVAWIQGYREMLRQCLRVTPRGKALTTEENADPWNDQLHAWLMVNTRESDGEVVPLYPAVYGGRAISFGFQYIRGGDVENRYPFRLKMARAFVFGSQLGWVGAHLLDEKFETEAEFLKTLCHARHGSRDALQYGELLPPVSVDGGGTVSWVTKQDEKDIQHTQPAVLASAWLTPDGKRMIALANVADDARTPTLSLNALHVPKRMRGADEVVLRSVDGGEEVVLRRSGGVWRGAVRVLGRGAFVVEVLAR